MSTDQITQPHADASLSAGRGTAEPVRGVSWAGMLASEWIKLRSLRSTWWIAIVMVGISAAIAAVISLNGINESLAELPAQAQRQGVTQLFAVGAMITQLAAVVLGALSITGEYGTGMIRSTMTAAPTRVPVYLAKATVVAAVAGVIGIIAALAAYLVSMPVMLGVGVTVSLFEPQLLVSILLTALYLVAIALFAYGLGAVFRSSAGALATAFAAILVVPIVLQMLPFDWVIEVQQYLLTNLGGTIIMADWTAIEPGEGLRLIGSLLAWPAATSEAMAPIGSVLA